MTISKKINCEYHGQIFYCLKMTIEFDSVFFLVTLKFPSFTEQIFQDPFPCDVNPIKSVYAEFSLT